MHGSLSRLADLSRDGGMLVRARTCTWRGGVGKEGAEHQNYYSIVHTRAVLFSHVLVSRVVACARARSHALTYLSLVTCYQHIAAHHAAHSFIPGLGCTSPNRRVKWRGPTAAMSSTPIGSRMSPMILAIKRTKLSYAWHVMVMRVSAVPPSLPTCVHVCHVLQEAFGATVQSKLRSPPLKDRRARGRRLLLTELLNDLNAIQD